MPFMAESRTDPLGTPSLHSGTPRPAAERPSRAGLLAPGSPFRPAFPACPEGQGQWRVE